MQTFRGAFFATIYKTASKKSERLWRRRLLGPCYAAFANAVADTLGLSGAQRGFKIPNSAFAR
nr:hypothetical protein [uncultured Campylobacter sp.]